MTMRRRTKLLAAPILGLALSVMVPATVAGAATPQTINVGPGDSIQAAVDAANAGDLILVSGTHHEAVTVYKDKLRIEGTPGSLLLPPPGGAPFGILIADLAAPPSPDEPPQFNHLVNRTTIKGMTVQGFDEMGFFNFGSTNTRFVNTTAIDNGEYGFFALESSGTTILNSVAYGSGEAGFYIGGSPDAAAVLDNVEAFDNLFGIFIRDAHGITVTRSDSHDNCLGMIVLADAPGPAGGTLAKGNSFSHNQKACPANDEGPPISGVGVALLGGDNVRLVENTINDNVPTGDTIFSAGVAVVTGEGGTPPSDNRVKANTLSGNALDILWDGTGTNNQFHHRSNTCTTSEPADICPGV